MRHSPAPPARRAGFTLIELMVCVVIIGVLAAVSVPRFANTKGKANLAAVKSDLHNLITAQETYFNEHQAYAASLASLALLGSAGSQGVSVTLVEATASGWSAQAVHPAAVPVTCAVFYGQAAPLTPATVEGVIACR